MAEEAIPAATLILAREGPSAPPEFLMVERSAGMAFAAGALVFPGGRIDQADHALAEELGVEAAAVAAVRETLEETAIPAALNPYMDQDQACRFQQELTADTAFGGLLAAAGINLNASALTPFARWVPKFHAVRRFDTLFYLAKAPQGDWQPKVIEGECVQALWISASEVLERERRAEARLIFPTRRTLERLAQHRSFDEIREDALAHPIEPVTPWVEDVNGEKFITIPEHLGFPVTRERLDGLWRG